VEEIEILTGSAFGNVVREVQHQLDVALFNL
jgi:hypothetical protein